MNVSEALALPSFEGATVIAGEAGLLREVSTATIVEAPDIDAWGAAGQLLITSFYAFEGLGAAELASFFEKAAELGIGAIVFKPERLLAEAPAEVVRLCDEHAIPLVQVAAGTKYESLLLDVLGSFLEKALEQKAFYENNNLMRELLTEPSGDASRTQAALKALGIDTYANYEVMVVKVSLAEDTELELRSEEFATLRRRLKARYPKTAYLETNDALVFLHNVKGTSGRYEGPSVASAMCDAPAPAGFTYLAALSSLGKAGELPRLMQEATEIARFFDGKAYKNSLLRFEDLGIYKLFMQVNDSSELMGFVDPRVRELCEESPELFETARVLCDNCLNYQETARQLYMHPKTIRYRAERVSKLSGLNFHNPDDRLQIAIGARIYRLLESSQ